MSTKATFRGLERGLLAVFFALSLAGTGCASTLKAKVQVYGGEVKPIDTPVQRLGQLSTARAQLAETQSQFDNAAKLIEELQKDFQKLQGDIASETTKPTYKKELWSSYAKAWAAYASAAGKSAQTQGITGRKLAEQQKEKAQAIHAVIAKSRYPQSIAPFLFQELQARVAQDQGASAALAALELALPCAAGTAACDDSGLEGLHELLAGGTAAKAFESLAKALDPPGEAKSVGTADIFKNELKSFEILAGGIKNLSSGLTAKSLELHKAAVDATVASVAAPDNAEARAKAMSALSDLRSELLAASKKADETLKNAGDVSTQFAMLAKFLKSHGADIHQVETLLHLPALSERFQSAREIIGRTGATLSMTATELKQSSTLYNLVDPNLHELVKKENEDNWQKPIDKAFAKGNGEAEFVFVQEGPTRFSIKQLHADPKSSADLALSVADVGVEIATTIIKQQTGVSLSGSGSATATASASGDDKEAAKKTAAAEDRRKVIADCRASIKAFATAIGRAREGVNGKPEDKASAATIQSAQGVLSGYRTTWASCSKVLKNEKPKPEGQ